MILALLLFATPLFAQQPRIASDFEIAEMKKQLARSHDFLSQLSGHLNLGDSYLTRSETATARAEYEKALELANAERLGARKASDMTRYATATAYTALAEAKLGMPGDAFAAAEESIRYTSGSAKSWNLYASAMSLLGRPAKAASASRNAVAIESREVAQSPAIANELDLAVYRYTLASALIDTGNPAEAERLLETVTSSLRGAEFASLRRNIARTEAFEVYSTARGDEQAYLSLLNRAGLKLASLLESRGDRAGARSEYERVLETRSDDPTALTALARWSPRYFDAAFDANPFSMTLVRAYQSYLDEAPAEPAPSTDVQKALVEMHRGEMRAARDTLDALLQKFPDNDTLRALRAETEGSLEVPRFLASGETSVTPSGPELEHILSLLQSDKITPEQRAALDRIAFTSDVRDGRIEGLRFTPAAADGRLTYRILGATEVNGADALLIEVVSR